VAGSDHLKPGERGTITVHVSTVMKAGSVAETVEVVSNDPKRPKIVLTLQAVVVKKLLP